MMKYKSIVPYFGGKRMMAPDIIAALGFGERKITTYCEPCCGGLGVFLQTPAVRNPILNDLHGDLMNLARVIQHKDTATELYEYLQRVVVCEATLRDAQASMRGPTRMNHVEQAYWYFIASWMGRNGVAGTAVREYKLAVRFTASGGSPAVRWKNAVVSIPAWHEKLQWATLLDRDIFGVLAKLRDEPETAIYVDPPYLPETRGNSSSGRYKHDFTDEDHTRLRDALRRFERARVVVSYYDHPRVREMYDGWKFSDHSRQKNLSNASGKPSKAPELLIINHT